jgi:hypothetical protein
LLARDPIDRAAVEAVAIACEAGEPEALALHQQYETLVARARGYDRAWTKRHELITRYCHTCPADDANGKKVVLSPMTKEQLDFQRLYEKQSARVDALFEEMQAAYRTHKAAMETWFLRKQSEEADLRNP